MNLGLDFTWLLSVDEFINSVSQQNSAGGGLAPPHCHLLHGNKIVSPPPLGLSLPLSFRVVSLETTANVQKLNTRVRSCICAI